MSKDSTFVLAVNGLFDAVDVSSVSQTETGVAVISKRGDLLYFYEESDKNIAKNICSHLSKAVFTAGKSNAYQPDWDALEKEWALED